MKQMKQGGIGTILFVAVTALLYGFYLRLLLWLAELFLPGGAQTILWLFLLLFCVPLAAVSAHYLIKAIKKYC